MLSLCVCVSVKNLHWRVECAVFEVETHYSTVFSIPPNKNKKTQNYLLSVAAIKLVEYFYQIPRLADILRDPDAMGSVAMSLAVFCAFCGMAPNLAWKKKLA